MALFGFTTFAMFTPVTGAEPPLRIFIRASAKTHGPGQHDYPRFLEEWKKRLNERGAIAEGALRFPTEAELGKSDVLIIYAADGNNIAGEERSHLESFLKRGRGLVVLHDGICGTNATWFASVAGGAKQHGEMNWKAGSLKLHFEDASHPIVKGISDFEIDDELFFRLRMTPETRTLATTVRTADDVVPQLWVYERPSDGGRSHRAFVSLQGHNHSSFSHPEYRRILLRGIAWAGKRPVDLFTRAPSGQ
ncbi:MAG: ThuA domain-containing protein [Verrucomicrobia bacterium]|nr:ThuA domain-containing protein [Verrucomicrobiota bacterium]